MNYYKKLFSEIIAQNKKLAVIGLMIMLFMSVLQVLIPLAMKEKFGLTKRPFSCKI